MKSLRMCSQHEISVNFRDEEIDFELDEGKQTTQNSQAPLAPNINNDDGLKKRPQLGKERESWGNKAEFILATIGLAVGLGNIWRFPYLCQKNGGGAFLIPFLVFIIIEGIPLFFIELGIGQRFKKSAVPLWHDIHPSLMGIGVGSAVASFMMCVYYIIVITWCSYFFFVSFTKELPWRKDHCPKYAQYSALQEMYENATHYENLNFTLSKNLSVYLKKKLDNFEDCCIHDSPQWFWYNKALRVSGRMEESGSGLNGHLVGCLAFSWIAVYFCLMKGVKSSGKVVYFTATFPYVVLIILFFRGVTLPGAVDGIKAYFTPKWELLLNAQIWMDAATQVFFSLSLGFGALIAIASYNPTHNNITRDAYLVVLIDCGTAIFAGVVVFSILGHREHMTGIPVAEVASGPGLAFIAISDAILLMDVSPLWAILFFFMLILLGIDSEFGTLEAAIAPFYDLKLVKIKRPLFIALCVIVMFLIGFSMVAGPGYYIFQIFDEYSVTLPLLIITLCQTLVVGWVYGSDRFADDIEYMTGKRPWSFWMFCWKYLSPLALIIILVWNLVEYAWKKPTYSAYVGCTHDPYDKSRHPGSKTWVADLPYPAWAQFIAAAVVLASCLPIPIFTVKNWPMNFKQAFRDRFCSGYANYMPDPAAWKKRYGVNSMVYEAAYPNDVDDADKEV